MNDMFLYEAHQFTFDFVTKETLTVTVLTVYLLTEQSWMQAQLTLPVKDISKRPLGKKEKKEGVYCD